MKKFKLLSAILVLLAVMLPLLAAVQKNVTFTFIPEKDQKFTKVYLAGEFNEWKPALPAYLLTKAANGNYTITIKLEVGKQYAYKFVLDGLNWVADKNAKDFVEDGFGGKNSVVIVK
jgi:predicted lipoprotein with Yx(FWY)xxD motif